MLPFRRKAFAVIAAAGIAGSATISGFAQDQSAVTGKLNGQVVDSSGAAIPDANVTVVGPQGTLKAKTNNLGRFELSTLSPGYYDVTVEKTGFGTVSAKHSEVTVSTASTLNLTMNVGSGSTTVEVTAAAVQLDTQSTAITSSLTDTFYNSIPMQRNVTAIFYAAPGAVGGQVNTAPNQNGPGSANPSIGGASGLENLYIVDGVTITDQAFGSIGTYNRYHGSLGTGINLAFIKEVDIKTAAFEPQYGKATGGIVQIVTKSGSNSFHGAVSAYFQPQAFFASRYQFWQFGYKNSTPYQILSQPAYDAAVELGGYVPALKDRLFFFGAFDPSLTQDYRAAAPGGNGSTAAPAASIALGAIQSNITGLSYAGKLTFKATDRTTLELTAFGDPSRHNSLPSLSSALPLTTASSWNYGSQDELARLDSTITPFWSIDLSYAYNHNHFSEFPSDTRYGISDQSQTSLGGAIVASGLGPYEPSKNNTYSIAANTSIVARLFGQHTFNLGYAYDHTNFLDQPSRSGASYAIPSANYRGTPLDKKANPATGLYSNFPSGAIGSLTNAQFTVAAANTANLLDSSCALCPTFNGVKVYASQSRGQYGGTYVNAYGRYHSAYGEDVYQMNRFVTFDLGVRWESQRMSSVLQNFSYGSSWSPRIGVNIDPLGDSKSKLFFNFGRNYWAAPLDAAIRQLGNELDDTSFIYAPVIQSDGSLAVIPDQAHLINGTPRRRNADGTVTNFAGPSFTSSAEGILSGTKQQYEDEYVIGFERAMTQSVVVKARYTDRRLGRIIEDIGSQSPEGSTVIGNYAGGIANPGPSTDIAVNEQEVTYTPAQYAAAQAASAISKTYIAPVNGCTAENDTAQAIGGLFTDSRNNPVGGACFLNVATADAAPGDGISDGFVKPVRRYNAIEFEVDKRFSNHWLALANFRIGNLWGNYEGAYRNDNGQSDPGISSLFDFTSGKLGLLGDQFTPGFLSSDRRAVGNIFLSYNIGSDTPFIAGLKGLTLGLGARGQSGVPLSFLGDHPIYLSAGEIPVGGRGAGGRTPSSTQLDLKAEYPVPLTRRYENVRLKLAMDMFNVTNSQFQTSRVQQLQLASPGVGAVPTLNADFNRPTGFQTPFNARGSVRLEF